MSKSISRLQFLRGDWEGKSSLIRPPSSQTEAHFRQHCTGCRACIDACPVNIIRADKLRYPYIDFRHGDCDFCAACANSCETEALTAFTPSSVPTTWTWRAKINSHCLTEKAVVCRSCAEICDQVAIHFQLQKGGIAKPMLDTAACNGCGACLTICPVNAIRLTQGEAHV